ncbi:gluconate 2-dehydrogenase subunit 3 family protein [Chitinophaga sp. GCM10012297]|uniref:Gluconate 2-dehydrogenase subunit 3 family protein n=1 Tax=Chitinophaga chungangae TaxID=2821488 RepID=A0ABS3YDR0_9BACT|nr:gluconate 2-dehydrogenase subunit 3 family protein [Chitinophaga chungangae]MBO9152809.1 gluconate 2-dehydrogenase subunit 3 family protein [Chitinophaga chungangae]
MDRRESLKALVIGSLSTGVILSACETKPGEKAKVGAGVLKEYGRTPDEVLRDESLLKETFFTAAEMKTITVLADIIIPKDETSGSASDAKVPEFIEFIVKDQERNKLPMRGGLRWLDMHSLKLHNKIFTDLSKEQQLAIVDQIAYPGKAAPELSHGVNFFSLMRNLTATGFFTSEMGLKDLGYQGNKPNVWDGVPEDVLKQYNLAYDEKMLAIAIKPDDRGKVMTWED